MERWKPVVTGEKIKIKGLIQTYTDAPI